MILWCVWYGNWSAWPLCGKQPCATNSNPGGGHACILTNQQLTDKGHRTFHPTALRATSLTTAPVKTTQVRLHIRICRTEPDSPYTTSSTLHLVQHFCHVPSALLVYVEGRKRLSLVLNVIVNHIETLLLTM